MAVLAAIVALSGSVREVAGQDVNAASRSRDLLTAHNRERAKKKAANLRIDDKLTTAAQRYAEYLAKHNKFSHNADGTLGTRLRRVGARYTVAGENLAKGQGNASGVVGSWMRSDGHRANDLNKRFRKAGFGVARDKQGALVWVAVYTN